MPKLRDVQRHQRHGLQEQILQRGLQRILRKEESQSGSDQAGDGDCQKSLLGQSPRQRSLLQRLRAITSGAIGHRVGRAKRTFADGALLRRQLSTAIRYFHFKMPRIGAGERLLNLRSHRISVEIV